MLTPAPYQVAVPVLVDQHIGAVQQPTFVWQQPSFVGGFGGRGVVGSLGGVHADFVGGFNVDGGVYGNTGVRDLVGGGGLHIDFVGGFNGAVLWSWARWLTPRPT